MDDVLASSMAPLVKFSHWMDNSMHICLTKCACHTLRTAFISNATAVFNQLEKVLPRWNIM